MASSEHTEGLASCPRCGRSAISSETPCSRCQPIEKDDTVVDKNTCQNCGETVSDQFRRVFGDNDGVVHACSNCTAAREYFEGAAATPGYTPDAVEQGHTDMEDLR